MKNRFSEQSGNESQWLSISSYVLVNDFDLITEEKIFKVSVETLQSVEPCGLAQTSHKLSPTGLIRQR